MKLPCNHFLHKKRKGTPLRKWKQKEMWKITLSATAPYQSIDENISSVRTQILTYRQSNFSASLNHHEIKIIVT